jgi:hypothetical protein
LPGGCKLLLSQPDQAVIAAPAAAHPGSRWLLADHTVDDAPVPSAGRATGLVELDLPAGYHRVDLRFTRARPDRWGSCSR